MIEFEKPIITKIDENKDYGRFVIEPLERGYGTTLGNSLRRVLLSSLPGAAVTSIKIDGVMHEFQKMDGVVEDVTEIILNLKKLVLKNHSENDQVLHLKANKEGEVHASDIDKNGEVEIINPDLLIATLSKGGSLDMTMTVSNGRGYVDAKTNKLNMKEIKVGVIPVDSNYSPIELVKYEVLDTRVGQDETYDKLVIEVTTNGSMTPEEALALSAKILVEHFAIVADLNSISNIAGIMQEKQVDNLAKTLETPIEEVDFSVRAFNCLKRHGIHTLQDLVNMKEVEVTKIRNLGKKSLKEVIDKVADLGLQFKE